VIDFINPWNNPSAAENPRVGGSIPSLATIKSKAYARLAQLNCGIF
jgi:hypothetical protein